jgi:nucleotide-binding universal stress UspA family protein
MTDRIIALVDASIYAKSVCDHAAWAAARTGLEVELLHVLGRREAPERQDLSGAIALGARSALLGELAELDAQRAKLAQTRGRAILDDARAIIEAAGVPVTASLRRGDVVEAVAEREADAAFVLIGKRGEAADFAKGHLGSNLERVVRTAKKPVLVASRKLRPVNRLLVAFDGGAVATRAVDHVARSPLYAGISITLVTVGPASLQIENGLADAHAMLASAGFDAETRVLSGQPGTVLGNLVEAEGFDMVLMGAYGHTRIRSMIIGSTTTEMIRSCKVPIMLVR